MLPVFLLPAIAIVIYLRKIKAFIIPDEAIPAWDE